MDILTFLAVLIPSALSLCTSGIYAYIALKKLKEPPKDEVWETATRLLCNNNSSMNDGDDFAILYEELKIFKENGCSMKDMVTLASVISERRRKEVLQQSAQN